ncbi:TBC1 domain family member 5-like isoform X2 [Tubulanus polymorphus]|uniref:TBC1 domain family member 5-like isoform X2 n=1 Tax=Tubulanus polymorphus TaxID=672921 RepID=UPI003DA5DBC9
MSGRIGFQRKQVNQHHVVEPAPTKEDILTTLDQFGGNGTTAAAGEGGRGAAVGAAGGGGGKSDTESSVATDSPLSDTGLAPSNHNANGFSRSTSFSNSYCDEWERLFNCSDYLRNLRSLGMDGMLRSCRFRSICWRVYLEVLPEDRDEWIKKTLDNRKIYTDLKDELIVNPHKLPENIDLSRNNPLSQEDESPWNQYFQDNELRLTIKQDVIRTFPELEFFQSSSLRDRMVDLLFCYARQHCRLSYRQGMHELLAPLIFVLHCDHQAFLHACELETVENVVKELLDPEYLEHDAYAMFCQVMDSVEPWYQAREITPPSKLQALAAAQPFARPQDMQPSNVIVNKLTRIQDYVLKKHDLELHMHMERLDIAPQIYGIRWLRLLFGREFPMQDLLVIWDAIFADGISFDLVDYIFVAMLLYIRDILLSSDYPTCLGVLMRYPPVGDVHYLIDRALYLRDPHIYPRPPNYTYQKAPHSGNKNKNWPNIYGKHDWIKIGPVVQPVVDTQKTRLNIKVTDKKRFLRIPNLPYGHHSLTMDQVANKLKATTLSGFNSLSRKITSSSSGRPRSLILDSSSGLLPKSTSEPMSLLTDKSPGSEPPTRGFHRRQGSSSSLSKVEQCSSKIEYDTSIKPVVSSSSLARLDSSSNPRTPETAVNSWRADRFTLNSSGSSSNRIEQFMPEDQNYSKSSRNGGGLFKTRRNQSKASTMSQPTSDPRLSADLAFLQGRMNDVEAMCRYCASKMDIHIEKLQNEMLHQPNLQHEDEIFIALAGLKQVRDILKGTLKFSHNMLDVDLDEICINDNHYRAEMTSSNHSDRSSTGARGAGAGSRFYIHSDSHSNTPSESEVDFDMDQEINNMTTKIQALTSADSDFEDIDSNDDTVYHSPQSASSSRKQSAPSTGDKSELTSSGIFSFFNKN